MEKQAEALYKLLSNYGTEFRPQYVLPLFIGFMAAWLTVVMKSGEATKDYWGAVELIYVGCAVAILIMAVGLLSFMTNRGHQERARLILAKARGQRVTLVRHSDFKRVDAVELRTNTPREPWSLYTLKENSDLGARLFSPITLTTLQAYSVMILINENGA